MPNFFNYNRQELSELLVDLGYQKFRSEQLMRWVYHQQETNFAKMQNIPKIMRSELSKQLITELPPVQSEKVSSCGTIKWLLGIDAKNAIETVYIPEAKRATLCISSQIGCALACQFCATGLTGFLRNLTTAEIISQVFYANKRLEEIYGENNFRKISNVVFMGMGEPLLNEANVFRAVDILLDDLAFGLSKYKVTVSTSGIVPAIERLTTNCKAALAISIHSANNDTRNKIVPINQRYPLEKLIKACDEYTEKTKRPITYEYVMLKKINDQRQDAQALAKLLGPRHAKINLIPYNVIKDLKLEASDQTTIQEFKEILNKKGLITTVRKTRGDDISAACGQLYGKVKERNKMIRANEYQTTG